MHLALKHQDQFIVLFGTEEHLVVLILILLYRSWNIKYIFYLSCYTISAINFFMQRDFLNVLIMFSPSYTSVVSTKYEHSASLFPEPVSCNSYAHPKCKLSSPTVRPIIDESDESVSRHISPLKLEIFWQSVLPTILSPPFCRTQS